MIIESQKRRLSDMNFSRPAGREGIKRLIDTLEEIAWGEEIDIFARLKALEYWERYMILLIMKS